jgi:ATP-dependent RNA circularization protein (DNA/RNA ligase family)
MSDFFRFPHTPHLVWLGEGTPRDDKVLATSEALQFLRDPVVLEEKVDGANLGLSIGPDGLLRAQNRGQYLYAPFTGQFSRLNAWLACHESALRDALGNESILFGEWLAATHSIAYDQLPDFLLVFDVYDRLAGRFWNTSRRNGLSERIGLRVIHQIASGIFTLSDLKQMVQTAPSAYRDGPCEGLYLRWQDASWLNRRAKLVSQDFVQGIAAHWRARPLQWNSKIHTG